MEDMYATMSRINEIRSRFNLNESKTAEADVSKTADDGVFKTEPKSFISHLDDAVQPQRLSPVQTAQSHVRKNMTVDEINTLAENAAKKEGISPSLVKAVIQNESGYDPDAVSPKGAMGLMQLMPQTAESLGVADPFSPEDNIRGGVTMLKNLLTSYKGDYQKAIAAYNAGKDTVDKSGGVPPIKETQDYVKRVIDTVSSSSQDDQGE
jgi:soluble lytic murein transglycosylase-like protein